MEDNTGGKETEPTVDTFACGLPRNTTWNKQKVAALSAALARDIQCAVFHDGMSMFISSPAKSVCVRIGCCCKTSKRREPFFQTLNCRGISYCCIAKFFGIKTTLEIKIDFENKDTAREKSPFAKL